MEGRILELSDACFVRQEKKVAQLKSELSQQYRDACVELGKQVELN